MQPTDELDELTLNAYVDGQLDPELERAVLNAMDSDPQIRDQVHALRDAKDWMRSGFVDAESPRADVNVGTAWRNRLYSGIAASFMLLAVGTVGGLLGYNMSGNTQQAAAVKEDPTHVVLHLDESDPQRFAAVLDYTEHLLSRNNDPGVQVEVIANAGGIDLMRVGVSPYEDRLRRLSAQYDNLHFIACANAIRNLRSSGEDAVLIDRVHTGKTAVDHIVERLRAGWTYKKITDLPGA